MKEMDIKKYLKIGIIILIIIAIYIFIAFKINGNTPIANLKEKYLIVDDFLVMKYENNKWIQLDDFNDVLENRYSIYDGQTRKDDLSIQYASNKWFFFKDEYEEVKVNNFRYAFTGTNDIKPANYNWEFYETTDHNNLLAFLNENGVGPINSFVNGTIKTTYDFDNDGTKETIYTTTNETLSESNEDTFSGMFMERNGKLTAISNKEGPYYIQEILDIDNDGTYEIIVSNGVINEPTLNDCYQIYKMKEKKWKLIKDCENK